MLPDTARRPRQPAAAQDACPWVGPRRPILLLRSMRHRQSRMATNDFAVRINADPDRVEQGLARLVLTLVDTIRKVLEHQAVRRMDGGTLSEAEIERLGLALMRLNGRLDDLKESFGLADEDLEIDLGPLGRLGGCYMTAPAHSPRDRSSVSPSSTELGVRLPELATPTRTDGLVDIPRSGPRQGPRHRGRH